MWGADHEGRGCDMVSETHGIFFETVLWLFCVRVVTDLVCGLSLGLTDRGHCLNYRCCVVSVGNISIGGESDMRSDSGGRERACGDME